MEAGRRFTAYFAQLIHLHKNKRKEKHEIETVLTNPTIITSQRTQMIATDTFEYPCDNLFRECNKRKLK